MFQKNPGGKRIRGCHRLKDTSVKRSRVETAVNVQNIHNFDFWKPDHFFSIYNDQSQSRQPTGVYCHDFSPVHTLLCPPPRVRICWFHGSWWGCYLTYDATQVTRGSILWVWDQYSAECHETLEEGSDRSYNSACVMRGRVVTYIARCLHMTVHVRRREGGRKQKQTHPDCSSYEPSSLQISPAPTGTSSPGSISLFPSLSPGSVLGSGDVVVGASWRETKGGRFVQTYRKKYHIVRSPLKRRFSPGFRSASLGL